MDEGATKILQVLKRRYVKQDKLLLGVFIPRNVNALIPNHGILFWRRKKSKTQAPLKLFVK